jgi:hypothetical protein
MQREDRIPENAAAALVEAALNGADRAYEAYSEFEAPTRRFQSAEDVLTYVLKSRGQGRRYFDIVVHYEGAGGKIDTHRFDLIPEKCQGAKWREKTEGWGLVSIQLTYQDNGYVKARVSANSEKRAKAWEHTLRQRLGPVDAWNWSLVEKHCRRLVRRLRSEA